METQQQQQQRHDVVIDYTGTNGRVQVMGGLFGTAELLTLAQVAVWGLKPGTTVTDAGGVVVYADTGGEAPVAFVAELGGNRVAVRVDAMEWGALCRAAAAAILQAGPVVRLGTSGRIRDRLMMLAMEN